MNAGFLIFLANVAHYFVLGVDVRFLMAFINCSLALALAGCGDPYKKELPSDGRVTPAAAKEIAEALPVEDRAVFERWVRRSISGLRFGGEPNAPNVRAAISNQLEFEQKKRAEQEEELAKEKEKKAEADRIAAQKVAAEDAARLLIDQRQKVAAAIREYFDVQLLQYGLVDITTPLGSKIGDQWKFSMRLKNLMNDADVVGFAGWLTIYDVFNRELESIPFRLEPIVKAGSTTRYDAFLSFDPKNSGHVAMSSTKNIRWVFFLESLALSNGRTIDQTTLRQAPAQDSDPKKVSKGV